MKRTPSVIAVGAAALLVGASTVPATAETTDNPPKTNTCSPVQMIMVQDVADSGATGGFLSEVTRPVLMAANGDTWAETSDVGSPASTTEPSPAPTAADSWKPDAGWGETTAAQTDEEWPEATTSAEPSPEQTEERDEESTQQRDVGRVVIEVENTSRERAYIPGVSGPDDVPAYDESIGSAAEEAEKKITEISEQCPDTKFVLMGVGQGAQVASTVAKRIGAGDSVDPDRVRGVALFADPSRSEDQPLVASGDPSPAGASGEFGKQETRGAGVVTVTGQEESEAGYGQVADRTVSWCLEGDTTCSLEQGTPLRALIANTEEGTQNQAPQQALEHVTDVLAPAVLLGGVETLAEDVQFGPGGFTFQRAASVDDTLIGRIAADSDRQIPQSEISNRLVAAGSQIGGMALAAGITVAKKTLTPSNIAQIAAASAISPAAGAGVALLKAGEASIDLVSPLTLTTAAVRLSDEAEAAGVDDHGLAEAAVQAAVSTGMGKQNYRTQAVNDSGQTASGATSDWLLDVVGQEVGRTLSDPATTTATASYASGDVADVLQALQATS